MGITHFDGLEVAGVPTMGMSGLPLTIGNVWFVAPATGNDGGTGAADSPFATIYWAFNKATANNNDVIVLVGNGSSSGTARLSLANAQITTPAATNGTLNWNKNATHLIGVASPVYASSRARMAPPTGTYTAATFGANNMVVVTGSGCIFQNISAFAGFSTGNASFINWTDNGERNYYKNCAFQGLNDTASAQGAGARSLKIGSAGSGENVFDGCEIGDDTTARGTSTNVNASLELAGGTPRNLFRGCVFPMNSATSYPVHVLATGAAAIDRFSYFQNCIFTNAIKSGATAVSEVISMTSASPGGGLILQQCTSVGATKWGDTNALANTYVDGGAPTAATTGLGVNPS